MVGAEYKRILLYFLWRGGHHNSEEADPQIYVKQVNLSSLRGVLL